MKRLTNLTVLVVEDVLLHATDLSMGIEDEGGQIVGPAMSVKTAMQLLERGVPDLAILDVQLEDAEVFPVADFLKDAAVPFVFYTSRSSSGQERAKEYGVPIINKAFSANEAIDALCGLMREQAFVPN